MILWNPKFYVLDALTCLLSIFLITDLQCEGHTPNDAIETMIKILGSSNEETRTNDAVETMIKILGFSNFRVCKRIYMKAVWLSRLFSLLCNFWIPIPILISISVMRPFW